MAALDPGYGDPLAQLGTVEWAKRWRLGFQSVVKDLPKVPQRSARYLAVGQQHRAWTLLTDAEGRVYADFDRFCADRQPWGLGVDPAEFRGYLAAAIGEKAADLVTVSPGEDKGGRPRKGEETAATVAAVSQDVGSRKAENLRAILRAPEVVQSMYREGLIRQVDAAALGPKSPTPEEAARIAEARQELERLDRKAPPRQVRAAARRVVDAVRGRAERSALDQLRLAWGRATPADRAALLAGVDAGELASLLGQRRVSE